SGESQNLRSLNLMTLGESLPTAGRPEPPIWFPPFGLGCSAGSLNLNIKNQDSVRQTNYNSSIGSNPSSFS
ncbi:hypothetical protein, partial [Daejeonella sp.]|uniref:hypothetical protein n=1 Tax=Daejeonella sp. TaxID=2805397 RepID=UPI0030BE7584